MEKQILPGMLLYFDILIENRAYRFSLVAPQLWASLMVHNRWCFMRNFVCELLLDLWEKHFFPVFKILCVCLFVYVVDFFFGCRLMHWTIRITHLFTVTKFWLLEATFASGYCKAGQASKFFHPLLQLIPTPSWIRKLFSLDLLILIETRKKTQRLKPLTRYIYFAYKKAEI